MPCTLHSDPDNGPMRAPQHAGEDRVLRRPRLYGAAREHHPPGHRSRGDGHAALQVRRTRADSIPGTFWRAFLCLCVFSGVLTHIITKTMGMILELFWLQQIRDGIPHLISTAPLRTGTAVRNCYLPSRRFLVFEPHHRHHGLDFLYIFLQK